MSESQTKTSAIFITGNSRSGTSMMAKILGNHSLIFGFHELHFFEQLWYPESGVKELSKEEGIKLFSKLISLQREGIFAQGNPEKFYDETQKYFELNTIISISPPDVFMNFLLYESSLHHKKIPCEQTPRNLFFIDEILIFYPDSKIVCMMRDPRDVLLSQKYKWKRRFLGHKGVPIKEVIRAWFNYHPITISKLWNSSAKKILSSVNKANVHLIKFEELLTEPETIIKKLCNFLNIDFNTSMLLVPAQGSSIAFDKSEKLGIDKTKSGNFLKGGLTKTEVYLCEKITSQYRNNFGYAEAGIHPNMFLLLWFYVSFPLKIFIALLLNLGRSKNLINSIKRRLISNG